MPRSPSPAPRRRLAACLALMLLALAAASPAAHAYTKNLWSTVNICDTTSHPNQLGIRARMPGNGGHQKMWMRFIAEYSDNGKWKMLRDAKTGWKKAGSALYTYQEFGWTFVIDLPKGTSLKLRGLVQFEWRQNGEIQSHAHRYTSAGHPSNVGDPKGYSAATCRVKN